MMRKILTYFMLTVLMFSMAGCGDTGTAARGGTTNGTTVDKVISDQINAADNESDQRIEEAGSGNGNDEKSNDGGQSDAAVSPAQTENTPASMPAPSAETPNSAVPTAPEEPSPAPADYDLTTMSSDMVYATVAQLMYEPDNYIGKTIRMNGLYYAGYYEPTGQYYHYCLIQDALACCAQGLEFVWDDGSHVYPSEYPAENAEIIVQGVFELYQEEGDEVMYCRLKDATMEVVSTE